MENGMGKCHTTGPIFSYPCRWPPAWLIATRRLWIALDRLRTGVGRFGTFPSRWGMLDTPKCICYTAEQSPNHIIFDCNILRPPNCLEDLRSPDIKGFEDLMDFV